eukprot:Skav224054  [mRNA]  locus=scaffold534:331640:336358:- [translate_table: standard]
MIKTLPECGGYNIWAVSETHLTAPGQTKCRQELKFHKTGMHLQAGAPVPHRSSSITSIGGKQRGVGFVTDCPNRPMSHDWSQDILQEARVHVACFQVGRRHIQGGVIYGHAFDTETTATKQATDILCSHLTSRLLDQSSGLRFIAGDFNQPDGILEHPKLWKERGWIHVQEWAAEHRGIPQRPTCKGVSFADHIYLSPELAEYLVGVSFDNEAFSDHAALGALLQFPEDPPMIPLWRQPNSLPWDQIPLPLPDSEVQQAMPDDPTQRYLTILQGFEQQVQQVCQSNAIPCPSSMLGRGATLEVRWVPEYSQPPLAGRPCDVKPTYHGVNARHAKWLRQLRRMHNFVRIAAQEPTTNVTNHLQGMWESIRKAAGFSPSFPEWWTQQQFPTLPVQPPDHAVAKPLYEVFQKYFRTFEQSLQTQRTSEARKRRVDDPQVIFRDLKAEPPQPVQMLLRQGEAQILEVDPDQSAVVTTDCPTWDVEAKVRINGVSRTVIHSTEDKLWLDSIEGVSTGDKVVQETTVGSLVDLFDAFASEWSKRWDRHVNTDPSFWDPIMDFVNNHMPQPTPMDYGPITYEQWVHCLRRKSCKAATGPDGVSRQDMLNMPRQVVQLLLDVLWDVEQGGQWPEQAINGIVLALEKQAGARFVQQFRPITLFPLFFRTWGSIRARQVLRHLQPLAPQTCNGNLPGKSAKHVWYSVLLEIELAQAWSRPVAGGVIDLVKAFNTLPRLLVLTTLQRLGVPAEIVGAWGRATNRMTRRFRVRNGTGPPLRSTTGFAEGDALSVCGMLGLNLLMHRWFSCRNRDAVLYTFVDNIEITAPDASSALRAMQSLERFSQLVDVQIDKQKSYVWSTAPWDRQQMRLGEYPVQLWARDMGGHMQYCRMPTNATIASKCAALGPLWTKVARSLAPYKQKIHAIKSKAWPSCMYGIESCHLGAEHFVTMRSGVVRSLQEHLAGASPIAHTSLIEHPMLDPQYYAIQQTVVTFRDQTATEYECDSLFALAHEPSQTCGPKPGPIQVVLARLHQLAWSWSNHTVFLDHKQRPIDVLLCPIQELHQRMRDAWQSRVLGELQHRQTFGGIVHASPYLTTKQLPQLAPADQALMRTALNGTFFTNDVLCHVTSNIGDKCDFCGEVDSQFHRHWECPHFRTCRTLPPDQVPALTTIAPCLANHGWLPEPPSVDELRSLCIQAADETHYHEAVPVPDHIHMFTDGSCSQPTCILSRVATWGVVLGNIDDLTFVPVACGQVHGWLQTVLRGELCAAINACRFAYKHQKPATLWTDNHLVFRRIRKFQQRMCVLKRNQKDADLWGLLQDEVHRLGSALRVMHVHSHQQETADTTEVDRWIFQGNHMVDHLAGSVLYSRPALLRVHRQVIEDLRNLELVRQHVHTTILQVGRKAMHEPKPEKRTQRHELNRELVNPPEVTFSPIDVCQLPPRYQFAGMQRILTWFESLLDPQAECVIVSWFQLNALFEHEMQSEGVRYTKQKKQWGLAHTWRQKPDFVKRTNFLRTFIKAVQDCGGNHIDSVHLRPQSLVISFWTMNINVRLPTAKLRLSDELLARDQPTYHTVKALRSYG